MARRALASGSGPRHKEGGSGRWRFVAAAALLASALGFTSARLTEGRAGIPPNWSVSAPSASTAAVAQIGLVEASEGWADNCRGLYLTTDAGATFRGITPPNVSHMSCISDHIDAVTTFGPSDIWVSVFNVPWLDVGSCGGCVDPPGASLDYSTDAGATWSSTGDCGELGCQFSDLSFSSPSDGVGMNGYLERTSDGGKSWILAGYGISSDETGGDELAAMEGSSGSEVWAATAPLSYLPQSGPGGLVQFEVHGACGCTLYSQPVSLPKVVPYGLAPSVVSLPVFFGGGVGVLATRLVDPSKSLDALVVYVTANGGATWTPRVGPNINLAAFPNNGEFSLPFSAASPTNWSLDLGDIVFATSDGGVTWQRFAPRPAEPRGTVESVDFVSPAVGWATLEVQRCIEDVCPYAQYLLATSNGGQTWQALSP